jgi:hypothetical protein
MRSTMALSEEKKKWVSDWYIKFQYAHSLRTRKDPRLNDKSPEEYWNECFRRWNSYPDANSNRKSWQANVVKPVTRRKAVAIIANVLQYYITPEVVARNTANMNVKALAMAFDDLLAIANERDGYIRQYLKVLTDAVVYGIAYIQDDYAIERRRIKDVDSGAVTNDDGTISYKEKEIIDFEGPRSKVLSPFEVYVGDVNIFDIQDQPYIFTREVMHISNAKREFGFRDAWKDVVPGSAYFLNGDAGSIYYRPMTLNDMTESEVEVLRVQCKDTDELAVFVQGVPMTEPGHPLPYSHKKYNINVVRYEVIDNTCFLGKSLVENLRHEQEVIDRLYRAILDKTLLNLFPPMLAKGGEMVNTDIIVPGRVTPIDTDAEYIVPQGVATGLGNEMITLEKVEQSMDSVFDRSQMGQMASGERSATQVNAASAGTEKILGLFANMVTFLVEDWMKLRTKNIVQFWARKERYLMTPEGKKTFMGIFERDSVHLGNGDMGSRVIEFKPMSQQPSAAEVRAEEEKLSYISGTKVKKIYIDPAIIRNFDIDVTIRANQNEKMTPLLEKAMAMEFLSTFKEDPDINQKALKQDVLLTMKKDPAKFMNKEEAPQPQAPEASNQMSQKPGNLGSQMAAMAQPRLKDLIQQG